MRKLILPIQSKKFYRELQFYVNDPHTVVVMLVTYEDGIETKRIYLGELLITTEIQPFLAFLGSRIDQ
jgi:hypothetical protein